MFNATRIKPTSPIKKANSGVREFVRIKFRNTTGIREKLKTLRVFKKKEPKKQSRKNNPNK
jgi:hypothetical protein